ncbi:hypothetical protein BayCH28_01515 [Mycolicibacterium sp. CH28]|uniref:hypothetical protein n=1 Tax=Mycolicibacterium sp. CH28 TaxID=2512237 RepID=UPI001081730A|nr:hypothetical protein [Mycolicibacterium sp. CH28]TGD90567.1 hypothetical protein BayCH28_01515 [Mycolicibacterium sp. CH28]
MTAAVETQTEEVGAGNPGTTTVRILAPYQTVHRGVVYVHGDTVEVSESIANYWISSGWATHSEEV